MNILTPTDYIANVAARKHRELLAQIEALEHLRPEAEALLAPFMAAVAEGKDGDDLWKYPHDRIAAEDELQDLVCLLLKLAGWETAPNTVSTIRVIPPEGFAPYSERRRC